jgi:transcriptional/translational regulatory protein YebC/TACO1
MGRAFEYRKATKMKRWGNMARVFTKLGKQITMAVKEGGPDPDTNPVCVCWNNRPRRKICRKKT